MNRHVLVVLDYVATQYIESKCRVKTIYINSLRTCGKDVQKI